ncbi:hypothetical protein [Streptomyces sp. CRN 30]|uniref:hypothetical protein n=1 Tax=Streptomyces sp. CRN 30 TaxID=3075613 RepID=UPI002A837660|nr:hypothetical protein [Streptomyces sp. CRN 30]
MPRIRVLEAIAGADFAWSPGDVVDVDDDAAAVWADGYRAVLVDDGPAAAIPAAVHQEPLVVDEHGQPLEVLAATVEQMEPTAGVAHGPRPVRWSVTVRLPEPAAAEDEEPTGPADPGNQETPVQPEALQPFDPREHTNKEVLAYLGTVGETEALRVLDTEATEGEGRAGISKNREAVLEAARARDAATGDGPAGTEKAAVYSRGGGGEPAPETRDW